jgi:hypothetical protein
MWCPRASDFYAEDPGPLFGSGLQADYESPRGTDATSAHS